MYSEWNSEVTRSQSPNPRRSAESIERGNGRCEVVSKHKRHACSVRTELRTPRRFWSWRSGSRVAHEGVHRGVHHSPSRQHEWSAAAAR